jgi:hypothetical protein
VVHAVARASEVAIVTAKTLRKGDEMRSVAIGGSAREQISESDEIRHAMADRMALLRNAERFFQHGFGVDAGLERSGGGSYSDTFADGIVAAAQDQNTLLEKLAGQVHIALLQNALRVRLSRDKKL